MGPRPVKLLEEADAAGGGAEKAAQHAVLGPVQPVAAGKILHDVVGGGADRVFRGFDLFDGQIGRGQIALDQIRAVDKSRLVKRLGKLNSETADAVLDTLGELFAP